MEPLPSKACRVAEYQDKTFGENCELGSNSGIETTRSAFRSLSNYLANIGRFLARYLHVEDVGF